VAGRCRLKLGFTAASCAQRRRVAIGLTAPGPDPRVRTALEPPYADRAPGLPSYQNEIGVGVIKIGAVEFHCVGALPPGDHPHIYLNMSGKASIRCPYCATNYVHDATLRWDTTVPPGCLYDAELEDRIDR
jgi:uncharacterized Zn-finger protein